MKKIIKNLLQYKMRFLAKAILQKYKPAIIGITGSIGKTSTKEAIYTVLKDHFSVRQNIKNYNNEIGLPLTIIGVGSGGSSVWKWLKVFFQAAKLLAIRDNNYPKILVLEMAVDRPGDMKYLADLAPCRIGVVTNVGPVHLEYFGSIEKIAKEKANIISHLPKNNWAVLNNDNDWVANMKSQTKARVLTYGIENNADIQAKEIIISREENKIAGLNFKLCYEGNTVPVLLPNVLGEHFIYSALAATAVALIYEMNLVEISQALCHFRAPKGRMNLITGMNESIIIDDTYNASPESTLAAVKVLGGLNQKKIAILGDMLELGDFNEEGHRQIGQAISDNAIDYLIVVGQQAKLIAQEANAKGISIDHIFLFEKSVDAIDKAKSLIDKDTAILVKGSQGMRMEKVVKAIMQDDSKAEELLVRQDYLWQN